MQTELIELAVAIVGLTLIMIVLRRASAKSRERAPESVKERLGLKEETEPDKKKKRPKPEAKPEAKKAEKKQPEPEPEEEADEEAEEEKEAPSDAETAAAYKAGLAKTRGGFVAKLGKIFGKKKI